MKKTRRIYITIISLIIISTLVFLGYNLIKRVKKEYKVEEIKQYEYFVLKQNELFGVIDKKGNTIISPEYNEVKIPNPRKASFYLL